MKIMNGIFLDANRQCNIRAAQSLKDSIQKLIINTHILPGSIEAIANEHRQNMLECLKVLMSTGEWSQQQNDAKNRSIAVGMQATIETALMNALMSDPKGRLSIIVHTTNPPTPLCAENISDSLLHSDIRNDLAVHSTVTSRVITNRHFLQTGHQVSFCALYGTERSNLAEQAFFNEKVEYYPSLFALHTNENPPSELSGATYIYINGQNEKTIMGVRITQANGPSEKCSLFIGKNSHDGKMQKYLCQLNDYVQSVQDSLPEGHSVQSRRYFFELMAIQNMISE